MRLDIYNVLGQRIATLVNEEQTAGTHVVKWDVGRQAGALASGVYFYRLEAGEIRETRKMVLMK